jgi:hypothetical protein
MATYIEMLNVKIFCLAKTAKSNLVIVSNHGLYYDDNMTNVYGQTFVPHLADFGLTANTRHLNKERLGTSKVSSS